MHFIIENISANIPAGFRTIMVIYGVDMNLLKLVTVSGCLRLDDRKIKLILYTYN